MTVQAEDAGSGVELIEYRRPGILTGSTTTTATLTIDTQGDNILETRVTDNASNQTAWRRQHFKIDTSLPVDTTDIPTGWQGSNSFTLAATDAYSGVDEIEYTINGGGVQVGEPGDVVNVGADGVYTIVTRVIDNATHSSAYTTRTLKVDTVDPVEHVRRPRRGLADTTAFELALSGTDLHLDTMQWRIDGGAIHDGGPAVIDRGRRVRPRDARDRRGRQRQRLARQPRARSTQPLPRTRPPWLPPAGARRRTRSRSQATTAPARASTTSSARSTAAPCPPTRT